MMTKAQEKLKDGFDRLRTAGDNPDLLGLALLGFHGALEDHFRDVLEFTSTLSSTQRARVQDTRQVQWKELIDLMQQHHHLNAGHKDWILSTNKFRQEFAHGGRFSGTRREVERYGEFVRTQINGSGSSRPIVKQRQTASRSTAKRSTNSTPSVISARTKVRSFGSGTLPKWTILNFYKLIVTGTIVTSFLSIFMGWYVACVVTVTILIPLLTMLMILPKQ